MYTLTIDNHTLIVDDRCTVELRDGSVLVYYDPGKPALPALPAPEKVVKHKPTTPVFVRDKGSLQRDNRPLLKSRDEIVEYIVHAVARGTGKHRGIVAKRGITLTFRTGLSAIKHKRYLGTLLDELVREGRIKMVRVPWSKFEHYTLPNREEDAA